MNDDADFFDEGKMIRCKAHDARFDPLTGLCVKGPRDCVGKKSLRQLEVSVVDNQVHIYNIPDEMLEFRRDFRAAVHNKQ